MRETIKNGLLALILVWIFIPTGIWMVDRWTAGDSYYAHGFLIPLVTLYWLWQKRQVLRETEVRGSFLGIPVLAAAVLLQVFASVFRIYFISAVAFVILLAGIILFLYGTAVFRRVWYPVAFLTLMIPLPLLTISEITLRMKFLVSDLAGWSLTALGIQAVRQGSYLTMENSFLLVGDPCSGLRSFLAFLSLGFVFAYGGGLTLPRKAVLIAAGLPIAIASNVLRVMALGFIAEVYGMGAVEGKIHDISGYVVFILAFGTFMIVRQKLEVRRAA